MTTATPKERKKRRNWIRPGQIQVLSESIARGYAKFGIVMAAEHLAKDVEFQFFLGYFKVHQRHLDEIKLWAERVQPLMTGEEYTYPKSVFEIPYSWRGTRKPRTPSKT